MLATSKEKYPEFPSNFLLTRSKMVYLGWAIHKIFLAVKLALPFSVWPYFLGNSSFIRNLSFFTRHYFFFLARRTLSKLVLSQMTEVLYICVGFWLLFNLTCDLSQAQVCHKLSKCTNYWHCESLVHGKWYFVTKIVLTYCEKKLI